MTAWDTETFLIEEYVPAPELVCVSFDDGRLLSAKTGASEMDKYLSGDEVLIGHNTAFDLAVLCMRNRALVPEVFEKYRRGQIRDTRVREQILDKASGKLNEHRYSLKDLARRRLKKTLRKDQWRLGYQSLVSTPIEKWPQGARDYAIQDAVTTRAVHDNQGDGLPGELEHALGAWAMYLMGTSELRGNLVHANFGCLKSGNISKLESIRDQLIERDVTTDITSFMSKRFATFVFNVRRNIGAEILTWGAWGRG